MAKFKLITGAVSLTAPETFASRSIPAADGVATRTLYALPVLPAGGSSAPVDDRFKGGSLLHDNVALAAAFNAKRRPLPIDVGHEVEYSGSAPAVGWGEEMFVEQDGSLWVWSEMLPEGEPLVAGKRFGFTSPSVNVSRVEGTNDRRVTGFRSHALTNNPALEMSANFEVDAEDETDEQPAAETVALTEFTALQGTVTSLTAERDTATSALAAATEQIAALTAAAAQVETLTTTVASLTAERDAATAQLATFTSADTERQVTEAVDAHIRAFKSVPATRDRLLAFARADLTAFKEFSAATPAMSFANPLQLPNETAVTDSVDPEVRAFLTKHGLPVEAYQRGRA